MLRVNQLAGFGAKTLFPYFINSNNGSNSASATTLSWTHTTTAQTTCLIVGGFAGDNGTTVTITGVTFNGIAMTEVQKSTSSAQGMSGLWVLFNPPIGAFTVTITCGSLASRGLGGQSANFGNASGINISGVTNNTTSNPMSTAITSTRIGLALGNCATTSSGGSTAISHSFSSPAGMIAAATPNAWISNSFAKLQGLYYSPTLVPAGSTTLTTTFSAALGGQHQQYAILI